jgi:putative DNA-invertase from lambdoid prophage Rac
MDGILCDVYLCGHHAMGKRIIFYARVSTADQNVSLQQKQAESAGFKFDEVVIDEGVSGYALKLKERDGGKRLFYMLRKEDTLVVRWVDRLGRNYADISAAIRDFMARGVVIRTVINDMTFDGATSDPLQLAMRDAMIGFMAAMAQAQVEASKAAQKIGIEFAKQSGRYLGRKPTYTREQI